MHARCDCAAARQNDQGGVAIKNLRIAAAALALLAFAASAVAASASGRDGVRDAVRATLTTSDDGPGRGRERNRRRGRHDGRHDHEHGDHKRREAGGDVRGPCDEAEHARDPRCAGSRRTLTVAASAAAAPAAAAPAGQTVRVVERSYSISLVPRPRAGRTTFVVSNASGDEHDFWLSGGGRTFRTRRLDGGGTARLTVVLKKGVRYRYFCAVGSHAEAGMSGSFVAR